MRLVAALALALLGWVGSAYASYSTNQACSENKWVVVNGSVVCAQSIGANPGSQPFIAPHCDIGKFGDGGGWELILTDDGKPMCRGGGSNGLQEPVYR